MTSMTIPRAATGADRRAAALRRAAAAAERTGRLAGAPDAPRVARTMPPDERRARSLDFAAPQLRAKLEKRNGQELYHLQGHASVVDTPYEMWDWYGAYDEIIDATAFDETLGNDPDVAFLVNHRGVTMARTTNGTLELAMDDVGLLSDAWLNPKRQDVSDLVVAIDDGNVDQMSFAFMLDEGWWNDDFTVFKITKVDIHRGDVSAVNYGANPYTDIAARSHEFLRDLRNAPPGLARAALAQLERREDLRPTSVTDVERESTKETPRSEPVETVAQRTSSGRSIQHIEALLLDE